jgi:hypothetical protein
MVCIGKCHLQRSLYTRTLIHSLSSLPPSSPSLLHPPGHSRERRDTDKRLREEQDIAFQASLEADKAKKRERQQHLVFTTYLVHPLLNCMYIPPTLVSHYVVYTALSWGESFGPLFTRQSVQCPMCPEFLPLDNVIEVSALTCSY